MPERMHARKGKGFFIEDGEAALAIQSVGAAFLWTFLAERRLAALSVWNQALRDGIFCFWESAHFFPHIFAVRKALEWKMGREWMKEPKESGSLFRTGERRQRGQAEKRKVVGWLRKGILAECLLLTLLATAVLYREGAAASRESAASSHGSTGGNVLFIEDDYIKWVDFTVSYEALCKAYEWDVETHGTEHEIDWVELLAYTAARTGGEFDTDALKVMEKAAEKLSEGESTMEELTEDLKYFTYYLEAYDAAIGGLVGEYWEENSDLEEGQKTLADAGKNGYVKRYGLKGYFPLARGFDYTHYDDFGAGRSYGYQRKHLG